MLTDSTRRDLQQLRFLLEEALARSQHQAEIDRRAAVLLLDGACEYAMGLALGYRGLRIDERFAQKYSDLRTGLPGWQPDTWTSIRQLHEARNLAQHHGALADPSLMPTWAAQTQRFVSSLVSAAFGVELQSVVVAESVSNDQIRRLLVDAERALVEQDPTTAFEVRRPRLAGHFGGQADHAAAAALARKWSRASIGVRYPWRSINHSWL